MKFAYIAPAFFLLSREPMFVFWAANTVCKRAKATTTPLWCPPFCFFACEKSPPVCAQTLPRWSLLQIFFSRRVRCVWTLGACMGRGIMPCLLTYLSVSVGILNWSEKRKSNISSGYQTYPSCEELVPWWEWITSLHARSQVAILQRYI
jgi:hypothetical protein